MIIRHVLQHKSIRKLLKVKHRQLVFTIPFKLRIYFRKHRDLLSLLFKAVSITLTDTLKDKAKRAYKREGRKLGFISFPFFRLHYSPRGTHCQYLLRIFFTF